MQTHIILVRHGQTQANIDRLWHGSTNTPLTATGHEQAQKVAQRLAKEHPDARTVYSSPLERTRDTATAIASALSIEPVVVINELQEYGIGVLEGSSFTDLERQHDFFSKINADHHYSPEGGESIQQVTERITQAIHQVGQQHRGEKVIAVSHGAAMGLALANLLDGDPYAWGKYMFQNTSVSELIYGDQPELIRLNCYQHL